MSRRLLFFCTVGAGFCALLGLLVATYAVIHTPGLHNVPVYTEQGTLRFESKLIYLYWPVFFQLFLFALPLYDLIKWRGFRRRILRSTADFNAQRHPAKHVDSARLQQILCYGGIGMEVITLVVIFHNAFRVLSL